MWRYLSAVVAICAATVEAQERGFAVHRADPTTAGSVTFLVERPWYSEQRMFAVGLTADYAYRSLVPRPPGGSSAPILDHAFLGRVDLAVSFFDRLTLAGSLPVALLELGASSQLSQTAAITGVAIGDPRVGVLLRVFGHSDASAISGHVGADVWIPIGAAQNHQGDLGLRVMPRALLSGAFGWARYSFEGAFLHRPYSSLGPPALGLVSAPELRGGLSLGVVTAGERLYLGPEARFSVQVAGEKAFSPGGMSLELLGGASLLIADQFKIGIAGGTGVFGMAGTADARAFVRLAWTPSSGSTTSSPPETPDAGTSQPAGDADADGVPDGIDRCPFEPESRNGVRDADGCPEHELEPGAPMIRLLAPPGPPARDVAQSAAPVDVGTRTAIADVDAGVPAVVARPDSAVQRTDGGSYQLEVVLDSDADGLPDDVDRCPLSKEDLDGFEDDDGCAERDNDDDGVLDLVDRCALEAETVNGWEDEDGCPDQAADADKDSIADAVDRCPFEAENLDGARDEDGCPEFVSPGTAALATLLNATAPVSIKGEPATTPAITDLDRDGVNDREDRCPVTPEDPDGFEDEDGCSELDNDDDGIGDKKDKCPDDAETINGFKDDDGCPDEQPDADGDGLAYQDDRCPLEPGDASDGCPHLPPPALALADVKLAMAPKTEAPKPVPDPVAAAASADFDKDTIPDDEDRCPVSREDADEFEDDDGCPEPDNDLDGIDDAKDQCAFEAETINGKKDEDGCPDEGEGAVTVTKDAVVIKGVIQFKSGSATLEPSASPLLKQVAATLRSNASTSVEIQGHTDDVGNAAKNIALSKRRAEAIRAFLIKAKVPTTRLVATGFGPTRPRASNKTPAGRELNRRVEFLILGEAK